MLWLSKSHLEKSGVFHTPIFHSEGLGQTNSKNSEHKISRDKPERRLPEIPENGWRGANKQGSVSIFTCVLQQFMESSVSLFRSQLIAKTVSWWNKATWLWVWCPLCRGKQSLDWEVQCLTNNEALFLRDFGKSKFYRVRRGNVEKRHGLLGDWGFPSKASKPCFLR